MGPKKGYWRLGAKDDRILECPFHESCLGYGTEENISLTGRCSSNYTGILC